MSNVGIYINDSQVYAFRLAIQKYLKHGQIFWQYRCEDSATFNFSRSYSRCKALALLIPQSIKDWFPRRQYPGRNAHKLLQIRSERQGCWKVPPHLPESFFINLHQLGKDAAGLPQHSFSSRFQISGSFSQSPFPRQLCQVRFPPKTWRDTP